MSSSTVPGANASGTATATTVPSPSSTGSSGGGGVTNSPLIFFVALGFGVIFTNLWIIVGVKYCFRYNQRVRLMRQQMLASDGESVTAGSGSTRPRRRREKKVLLAEQVDRLAPVTPFSVFRAGRTIGSGNLSANLKPTPLDPDHKEDEARRSIDTAGPPASVICRPDSQVLDPQAVQPPSATFLSDLSLTEKPDQGIEIETEKPPTTNPVSTRRSSQAESDDEADTTAVTPAVDEPDTTTAAAPAADSEGSSDTCTICFDSMTADEPVRGLPCGHAFHPACVDPWLTTRRACCPNCKADYFVAADPTGPEPSTTFDAMSATGNDGTTAEASTGPTDTGLIATFRRGLFQSRRRRGLDHAFVTNGGSATTLTGDQPHTDTTVRRPSMTTFGSQQSIVARTETATTTTPPPASPQPDTADDAVEQATGPDGARPESVRRPLIALRNPFRRRREADLESGV